MSDEPRRGIAPRAEGEGLDDDAVIADSPREPSRAWSEPARSYEPGPVLGSTPATPTYRPAARVSPPAPGTTGTPVSTPVWYPPLPERDTPYPIFPEAGTQPTDTQPIAYSPAQLQMFAPAPATATAPEATATGRLPSPPTERALPLEDEDDDDDRGSFGAAIAWTIAGTAFPGVGLIRGRRLFVGIVTLLVFLALAGGVGYLLYERHLAVRVAMNPGAAISIAAAAAMLAIVAAGMVLATYSTNRPSRVRGGQRVVGGLVVGFLCLALSAPLAVVSAVGYSQARLVSTLFASSASVTRPTIAMGPVGDLWANTPRINILLVSGDGTTTDSMIVASTDTATGNTVLISVPRTLSKLPFPATSPLIMTYPDGYWDGVSTQDPASWANSIWATVPTKVAPSALGTTSNLGADALKLAIGEALGLRIDYYVYATVAQLYTLLDAVGGVTLDVQSPIAPSASSAVEPGAKHHLDADQILSYGWTGAATDAEKMSRQRCVVDAVVAQVGPMTVLRYAGIAQAGAQARTDVPQSMLAMLTELAVRVRRGQVTSMQFSTGENRFDAANPNFATMRQQVSAAVAGSADPATAKVSPAVPISQACGAR